MAVSSIPLSVQYPNGFGAPFLAGQTKAAPSTTRTGPNTLSGFRSFIPQIPSAPAATPLSQYRVNPATASSNPDTASADLARKQSAYFQNRGAPLEDAALADITDPNLPKRLAAQAGQSAGEAIDATAGMERRNLSRFGVRPTSGQLLSLDRRFGLDRALAVSGASNQAYAGGQDTQLQLAGDALQIGRGISGQAARDLSTAGSLATGRQAAARQAASAQNASRVASVAGGAGLGFMAGAKIGSVGGPVGAVIGGGIGLLASFLG